LEIKIKIPLKADIVFQGFVVSVSSAAGTTWKKDQLGDYAKESGVYVHHCNGKILYVGKTTNGKWGTFGERLRREFQRKASANSNVFQLLQKQTQPVKTVMFDLNDIDMMVDSGSTQLSKTRKALIFEQVLIGVFDPEGNKI
jgi:hypothetical protein